MIGRIILVTLSTICAVTSSSYPNGISRYFSAARSVTCDSAESGRYNENFKTDRFEDSKKMVILKESISYHAKSEFY